MNTDPGMRLDVYRITSSVERRVVVPDRVFGRQAEPSLLASAISYPPCQCPLCEAGDKE